MSSGFDQNHSRTDQLAYWKCRLSAKFIYMQQKINKNLMFFETISITTEKKYREIA
jgi:hypothetical protein